MPKKNENLPSASSVVLLTIDGWDGNWNKNKILSQVETPNLKEFSCSYPYAAFNISGVKDSVKDHRDLSERGYYAAGTGTDMCSASTFIDRSIEDGSFFQNKVLLGAIVHVRKNNSRLHLLGSASRTGKYASLEHLKNLLQLVRDKGIKEVYIHVILDGRDSAPNKGIKSLKRIQKYIKQLGVGKIATIHGSFYAMDRNNNWERVAKSYRALTTAEAKTAEDPEAAIQESYNKEIYDKEFLPTVITEGGAPQGQVEEGDSVIFFNTRGDRSRELTKAFVMSSWDKIPNRKYIKDLYFACFTEYEKHLPIKIAFPKTGISSCLSEVLDNKGWKHLKLSGVEKFPHLNYFFNGEKKTRFSSEVRELIRPEEDDDFLKEKIETTQEIGEKIIKNIKQENYKFIAANLAELDSFKLSAVNKKKKEKTVEYVEEVDEYIKKITKAARNKNVALILTSTSNIAVGKKGITPVPVLLIHKDLEGKTLNWTQPPGDNLQAVSCSGALKDLQGIILEMLGYY